MFAALNAFGLLRVTKDDETEGLDVSQHGNNASPEYAVASLASTHATGGQRPYRLWRG